MSVQFRNVSPDERHAQYGVIGNRWVAPDGLLEVEDDAAANYANQPTIWESTDPAALAALLPAETPEAPAPAPVTDPPAAPVPDPPA